MPDYKKLTVKNRLNNNRIKRANLKPKRNFTKLGLVILFISLFAGLILCMRFFLLSYSGFKIKKISVVDEQGKDFKAAEGIFHADKISLFSLDMKEIASDVRGKFPEFESVRIRKQFPNKVLIIIKAREPKAFVSSKGGYLVDAQGFVLPYNARYKHLPKIIGVRQSIQFYEKNYSLRLKKALDLLEELTKVGVYPEYKIARINVREYNNPILILENKTEIKVGDGEFSKKARLLAKILEQLKASGSVPKYIDMRFGNPVVKP